MRAAPQRYIPNAAPQDAEPATRSFINDELRRLSTFLAQVDEASAAFLTQADADARYALIHSPDNVKTFYGTGDDLAIYHDGVNTYLDNGAVGSVVIRQTVVGAEIKFFNSAAGVVHLLGTGPELRLIDSDATANERWWFLQNSGDLFSIGTRDDGGIFGSYALRFSRTGPSVDAMIVGATTIQGTDGNVSTPFYSFSLDPDSGMYRIGSNNIGWSVGGHLSLGLTNTTLTLQGSNSSELRLIEEDATADNMVWLLAATGEGLIMGTRIDSPVFTFGQTGYQMDRTGTTVDRHRFFCNTVARFDANTVGVAFNGQAPAARPDYTVTSPIVDRAVNGSGTGETVASLSATLGTLINDLIAIGLFQ
jgi:hypothetical protein